MDPRFDAARLTNQSGDRGWDFTPSEPARGWPWWVLTMVQLAACAAPVAFLVALIRIAEAMQ